MDFFFPFRLLIFFVFFWPRSVQESKSPLGNDYVLKPQTGVGGGGGAFLDHTNMSFNHGGKNI